MKVYLHCVMNEFAHLNFFFLFSGPLNLKCEGQKVVDRWSRSHIYNEINNQSSTYKLNLNLNKGNK